MNEIINVTSSSMPEFDEYVKEIKDLWDSKWITNMGTKHKQLEKLLLEYLNTPNISLFVNGHLALESIIKSLNLTGEVITTPFTFVSTSHAIVRNGLTPVFCDINPLDYTIDVNKIEALITDKTSAIIPVHVYGNICNVKEIQKIADKHNLKVIYDSAHAFGVEMNGVGISNFGDASIFSFHATKVFNTIEGGAVVYKDKNLSKKLHYIKNFGITGLESIEFIGGNAKMNEFQAAMGICNLKNIDKEIDKRKKVFERYVERLSEIDGIKICKPKQDIKSNYSYFPVIFEKFYSERDMVFEELKKNNIFARKYFYPLVNDLDCYKNRFKVDRTPIAKYISDRIITLPLYSDLQIKDVDKICNIILNIHKK